MPISDRSEPPVRCALATKSDTVNFADFAVRGVSFATAGDLKVLLKDDTDPVVIPSGALVAGCIHPMQVVRVYDTGTDVVDLVFYG